MARFSSSSFFCFFMLAVGEARAAFIYDITPLWLSSYSIWLLLTHVTATIPNAEMDLLQCMVADVVLIKIVVVVSPYYGPIHTSKYCNPQYGTPKMVTLIFGKPPCPLPRSCTCLSSRTLKQGQWGPRGKTAYVACPCACAADCAKVSFGPGTKCCP